jgi:hypothetical protein
MKVRWIAVVVLALFPVVWLTCFLLGGDPAGEAPPVLAVNDALPGGVWAMLRQAGWEERAGGGLGLWVSVRRQQLVGVEAGRVRFAYPCSTAARGTGNREGSNQTPPGWHEVAERIGDGLPEGAVFVERKYTGRNWTGGAPTEKDYVLTRILWLRGQEPGVNAGKGIDSYERFIYIHGTPAEDRLGTPASMGCIRLSNRAVIAVFEAARPGTPVLITEW